MAKGRKPQFSADDLMNFIMGVRDLGSDKPRLKTPIMEGTEKIIRQDVPLALDYLSPLTAEELSRLVTKGPDQGHLASLAIYAAAMGAPKRIKQAAQAYRGTKKMFKDAEAPAGARTQPRRTATTNMLGTINDPMAQYAALLAATRR